MNGTKLSLILLLSAVTFVQAEAPKEPAKQTKKQAPKISYFMGGEECGTLLIKVISQKDQAAQAKFVAKTQTLLKPLMEAFQKNDVSPEDTKKAWSNFQAFNKGFKKVFDKNTPQPAATLSDLEKKAFALSIEMQKNSYNAAISSADFASYNKTMQEKSQALMAKQHELQKEHQEQMASIAAKSADKK